MHRNIALFHCNKYETMLSFWYVLLAFHRNLINRATKGSNLCLCNNCNNITIIWLNPHYSKEANREHSWIKPQFESYWIICTKWNTAGCKIIVLSTYGFHTVWPFPKDIINQANKDEPSKHPHSWPHTSAHTCHLSVSRPSSGWRTTFG